MVNYTMRQRQEALTRLHYCATMFTSDKAKIVKYDLNISFKLNALIMNKPMSKKQLDPYFFTLKQTATYLNTSTSTYSRREREGGAPRGQKLFGRVKLYPRHEVILFAQGKWEGVK